MSVVYLDLLFLINLAANYLLLLITARMGGYEVKKLPFLAAALFGGLYASVQICGVDFLDQPLCKMGAGVLMPLIAWGNRPGLFQKILMFFAAAAALGGTVWAVELFGGKGLTLSNGVLYSWIDIRLLFLILVLSYGAITVVSDRLFVHRGREMTEVHITVGGSTVRLTGLLDTGNTLTEPVGNRPVLVAEGAACRSLLPCELPLERPVEALELLGGMGVKGFNLLPYRAVGVAGGMLLAVRAELVRIGTRQEKNMLVALSPTPVSDGGGYRVLIGGNVWN